MLKLLKFIIMLPTFLDVLLTNAKMLVVLNYHLIILIYMVV